jgi:hypothetical protein
MHPTRKLKDPQELLDLWNDYKQWRKNQGRSVPTLNQRTGEVIYMLHFPPLTIDSFITWTVNEKGWGVGSMDNYIENKEGYYSAFGGIVTHMKREAKSDRFDGAAVGQFKEGLISRLDGYSDRQQIEHREVEKFDFDE